jgi:enoyl-CoA hydratase/3-hydroxyacyl-CoA dehydrogenase
MDQPTGRESGGRAVTDGGERDGDSNPSSESESDSDPEPESGPRSEPATLSGDGEPDGDAATLLDGDRLSVVVAEQIGHVELDRPRRMNAIDARMLDELETAVDRLDGRADVRAVLLTGAGDRAFSVGADVRSALGDASPAEAVELSRRGQAAFRGLEAADAPVVAGIDGYCLGGGMELAAAADLRVAAEGARFAQPEADLGLIPGWGGTQRLARILGEGRATELVLTGDRYDAAEMERYGFLTEVVPDGEARDRARGLAAELAAGAPLAHRYATRAIRAGRGDPEAGYEFEAQAFGGLVGTDDFDAGLDAFVGDGEPEFQGG